MDVATPQSGDNFNSTAYQIYLVLLIIMRKTTSLAHVAVTANILQWYDFSISAYLAIALGPLFFGGHDDFTALIQSFSVFAVSYLMRPLGSMAFGYIGNRTNPGVALRWSTLLMAIPTVFIGLLPTYRDIGHTATILMVTLKLIQGFAAGGELPLSAYYVVSHADPQKKGLLSSLVHAGGISGLLLASLLAFLLSSLFSSQEIEHGAWRIPFLLGIPFFLVISKIRGGIIANGQISTAHHENNKTSKPKNLKAFFRGALLVTAMNVGFYTLFVWMPNYTEFVLKYSHFDAHLSNTLAMIGYIGATIGSGFFSRFVNYKKILITSLWSISVLVYPLFMLLQDIHAFPLLFSIQCIFALLYGPIHGVIWLVLYDLFKDNWKNFGFSITFTLPTAIFGGTAPLICSYLVGQLHYLDFPAFYLTFFSLIAIPAAYGLNSFKKLPAQKSLPRGNTHMTGTDVSQHSHIS